METRTLRFPSPFYSPYGLLFIEQPAHPVLSLPRPWQQRINPMKNERFVDRDASSRESFSNNFNPRRIEKEKNISYLILFYVSNRVFHFLQAEIQSKNVTPIFKKHVSKSFDSLLIFIYRACVSYLGIAYECRRVNVTSIVRFIASFWKMWLARRDTIRWTIVPKIPLVTLNRAHLFFLVVSCC